METTLFIIALAGYAVGSYLDISSTSKFKCYGMKERMPLIRDKDKNPIMWRIYVSTFVLAGLGLWMASVNTGPAALFFGIMAVIRIAFGLFNKQKQAKMREDNPALKVCG